MISLDKYFRILVCLFSFSLIHAEDVKVDRNTQTIPERTFTKEQKSNQYIDRFREWAKKDQDKLVNHDAFLAIGSSSMEGWKTIHEDLKPLEIIHRGIGGSQMKHMVLYADFFADYQVKNILVYQGDNDLVGAKHDDKAVSRFLDNCKKFSEIMKESRPDVTIYFMSPKPSPARWKLWPYYQEAFRLLKDYARETENIKIIDITSTMLDEKGVVREDIFKPDRLHMNAKGYEIWTREVRKALGL